MMNMAQHVDNAVIPDSYDYNIKISPCQICIVCMVKYEEQEQNTVVPVMSGHPRDQAKVSVHCRWLLIKGMDGQVGDAKYNTPCKTTYYYHHQRYSY